MSIFWEDRLLLPSTIIKHMVISNVLCTFKDRSLPGINSTKGTCSFLDEIGYKNPVLVWDGGGGDNLFVSAIS